MDFFEYKKLYKSIGSVKCPYFDNEEIVFNKKGFDHLLRKGKKVRFISEQRKRLSLLVHCKEILRGNYTRIDYEVRAGEKTAQFWGFEACINGKYMKVIVRQIENGSKHFFGIFPITH